MQATPKKAQPTRLLDVESRTSRRELERGSFSHLAAVRAKNSRALSTIPGLVNASHGGSGAHAPHESVPLALRAASEGRNLLGVLSEQSAAASLPLAQFIKRFKPPEYHLDLETAYRYLFARFREKNPEIAMRTSFEAFLNECSAQRTNLALYPDDTMGSLECRAVFREYFVSRGIPANKSMVITGNGGFKSLFFGAVAAVMTREVDGVRRSIGGDVLAGRGHYHSLVAFPPLFGGKLRVIPRMTAPHVSAALAADTEHAIRAIVVFAVDNPTGHVPSEREMRELAEVIAHHNRRHPQRRVVAIADDLYAGSVLRRDIATPRAFAAMEVDGASMHDHTLTIGSMSKTFGFASSRIGFATSGSRSLIGATSAWLRQTGAYHVPQPLEIAAAAALACTPRSWVEANNEMYRRRLARVRAATESLRARTGVALRINEPEGGWYVLLDVPRSSFGARIASLVALDDDLHSVLLYYGKQKGVARCRAGTGVVTFPGSVNGIEHGVDNDPDLLSVRLSLAVTDAEIDQAFERLGGVLELLRSDDAERIADILEHANDAVSHVEFQLRGEREVG